MKPNNIIKTIRRYRKFLISTHINPDPDGLSSELALALCLRKMGKKVTIVNDSKVPVRYQFLPGIDLVSRYTEDMSVDFEVAIIVDCGDLARVARVQRLIDKDKIIINIDHHETNDHFGHFNLVKGDASSAAEVVFDLIKELKYRLNKEIAILLYLGILTDTGSFRYENTSSRTHAIASQLMKFHFSISEYYKQLYETVPLDDLKLFTKAIKRFKMVARNRAAYVVLRKKQLEQFSEEFDFRDKIFSYLRSIKGIEVIVIFNEEQEKLIRVNFRSQGKFNVAQLASRYGGGGHPRASGCTLTGTIQEAKREILKQIKKGL
jgi:bifunctional oligoribonuclease and PAP phosphatase NrnA